MWDQHDELSTFNLAKWSTDTLNLIHVDTQYFFVIICLTSYRNTKRIGTKFSRVERLFILSCKWVSVSADRRVFSVSYNTCQIKNSIIDSMGPRLITGHFARQLTQRALSIINAFNSHHTLYCSFIWLVL